MSVRRLFTFCALIFLASCGLPRGAAFESEILSASNANTAAPGEEPVYSFAVYEVNRLTLPVLQAWPTTGIPQYSWIRAQEQPASLLIATGDSVQITIWDAEDSSIFGAGGVTALPPTQVNTAGRIFVPFIGDIRVSGMSPTTARQRIEEELVRTVPSAQVQLTVEPGRANTVNLASGFTAAGLFPLTDRNVKILDMFSQAGGPDPTFVSPQVRLVRDGRTFGVPFDALLNNPQLNAAVQGGDRIYIVDDERKFIALGATGSQSLFDFPKVHLSALEALAVVGGVNAGTANPESVLVMREYNAHAVRDGIAGPPQQRVVFAIDLTTADGVFSAGKFMLEDGDIIYGTESALGPALTLFNLGTSVSGAL